MAVFMSICCRLNQLLMFDQGHDFRRLLKFNARKSLAQLSMRLVELLGCYQQIKHWLIGRPAHYDRYDISRLRHEYVRHTDGSWNIRGFPRNQDHLGRPSSLRIVSSSGSAFKPLGVA
jgi:hypothetical protein